MSAPNEPGHPGNGGKTESAGNGPADSGQRPPGRTARITETGETPPWQRAGQARPPAPARPADGGALGHSPGVDERIRRFVSGTAAPTAPPAPGAPQQPPKAPPPPAKQPAPPAQPPVQPTAQAPKPPAQPAKPPVQQTAQAKPAAPKTASPAKHGDDAYGSELPDLSEPGRRSPGRRPAVTAGPRGPLRASMQIRRIDPWSALKVSLLLSTALFFVWMIAVAVLYVALGAMGVWSKLNSNVGDLLTNNSAAELVSAGSIFGGATLIGLVNIVVLTAMATLGVVVYNLSTDVVGGVEVTLADRD
ncbi:DUF3566 domain-containing protein [Mycolicibacter hiberniae]|uniref:Uncharacterized protein n=1 Tax=Mycolicibacter hiberniae TaxID=29314 RepID=A0A7I7X671_9MYCO|nr:DUF3566 domain-containing protein [Mycolicibacter hiberniae]MCV7088359.1 DUF3566 domain-containing protein [Mycolicibacter hiberniae]ORV68811.1 hypothetical protein AWC09_14365 [Mycolicibacter hiberniae]BBZ25216.1 hypothetical protein MHIB_36340 [Mycolicibacter hiberniae]